MKKTLERLQKQKDEIEASITNSNVGNSILENESKRTRLEQTCSNILPKECIFCKKNKKIKGSQSRENLTSCIDERAMKAIHLSAKAREDYKILSIQDLIAAEAHYHHTCHTNYVKVNYESEKERSLTSYEEAEQAALNEFGKFLFDLQNHPTVEPFSLCVEMITNEIIKRGEKVNISTRKNLRRKIETHFKSVNFVNVDGLLYIYPATLSIEYLIKSFVKVRNELKNYKQEYCNYNAEQEKIIENMKLVKKEITELEDKMPWPPKAADLGPEKFEMPCMLGLMLKTLLQGEDGSLSRRNGMLQLSIARDIVYAVTRGLVKTPKSILLPTLIKSLTNNTELININNKMGHGISYTSLMETQTENAYYILEQQSQDNVILPISCQKEAFTIYVADNIDRNEETISGRSQIFTNFNSISFVLTTPSPPNTHLKI